MCDYLVVKAIETNKITFWQHKNDDQQHWEGGECTGETGISPIGKEVANGCHKNSGHSLKTISHLYTYLHIRIQMSLTQLKQARRGILCSGRSISIMKVQKTTSVPPIEKPIRRRVNNNHCQALPIPV